MDERNGDCFDHPDLFGPLGVPDSDEADCLKDFLLDPPVVGGGGNLGSCSGQMQPVMPPMLPLPHPPPWSDQQLAFQSMYQEGLCGVGPVAASPVSSVLCSPAEPPPNLPACRLDPGPGTPTNNNTYPVVELERIQVPNGDCWSPATFTASASERTVSSDCVSSETVCSPSDAACDSPSQFKSTLTPTQAPEEQDKVKKKKKKRERTTSARSRPTHTTVTTYQSQISPDQNGIKIKIKKSLELVPQKSRKKKRKTDEYDGWEEPKEQGPWGERFPKPLLHRIFKMVTMEEGCVPFLVRMAAVCRLWRDTAILPDLWHRVDLSNTWVKNRHENDLKFRWLCENRLKLVQELNIGAPCKKGELRMYCQAGVRPSCTERLIYDIMSPKIKIIRSKTRSYHGYVIYHVWREEKKASDSPVSRGWEFDGIPSVLDKMASSCGELRSLSLSGWQGLSGENIKFLVSHCPKLQSLDLSGINPEMNNPKSAVSMVSLKSLAEDMGERLTNLVLSDNKLTGIQQILGALSTHCPNLQVLDLSNVRTLSHTVTYLNIEKMQQGCPLLRVLRLTNSEFALAPTSLKEQSLSEGFPELEELSVAGVAETSMPIIDDDGLQRILKKSHKLRLLDVRGCTRLTDSSLVRVPAWDLTHLFLSGCYVTRVNDSGLELICQKWAHSLVEVDLAWSTATNPLDAAVFALANYTDKSPLRVLNLCGSSVSLDPVKSVLSKCAELTSLNLSSCRAMPRGIKRLYQGPDLIELRQNITKNFNSTDD